MRLPEFPGMKARRKTISYFIISWLNFNLIDTVKNKDTTLSYFLHYTTTKQRGQLGHLRNHRPVVAHLRHRHRNLRVVDLRVPPLQVSYRRAEVWTQIVVVGYGSYGPHAIDFSRLSSGWHNWNERWAIMWCLLWWLDLQSISYK